MAAEHLCSGIRKSVKIRRILTPQKSTIFVGFDFRKFRKTVKILKKSPIFLCLQKPLVFAAEETFENRRFSMHRKFTIFECFISSGVEKCLQNLRFCNRKHEVFACCAFFSSFNFDAANQRFACYVFLQPPNFLKFWVQEISFPSTTFLKI